MWKEKKIKNQTKKTTRVFEDENGKLFMFFNNIFIEYLYSIKFILCIVLRHNTKKKKYPSTENYIEKGNNFL